MKVLTSPAELACGEFAKPRWQHHEGTEVSLHPKIPWIPGSLLRQHLGSVAAAGDTEIKAVP